MMPTSKLTTWYITYSYLSNVSSGYHMGYWTFRSKLSSTSQELIKDILDELKKDNKKSWIRVDNMIKLTD